MLRWILNLVGLRREQSETRCPKPTVKPRLEGLEERTLPSASPVEVEAMSQMVSTVTQLISTVENDVSSIDKMIGQEIAQEVAYVEQQWDHLLGIVPNAPNPTATPNPGSGSGSGSGATTTAHNAPNQPLNSVTQKSGSGSGSGATTTKTAHGHALTQAINKATPLTGSGPGSGSGSCISGSGSGSNGSGTGAVGNGTGSGSATVYGQVWLDNNGDGSIDNGEMGYRGITVELISASTGSVIQSKTTDPGGGYTFTISEGPAPGHSYAVQVVLGSVPNRDFQATLRSPKVNVSQINGHGTSAAFNLASGGWRDIEAGICSMEVTTTDDDPNGVLPQDQDQVTLRDAIETGNNCDGIGGHSNPLAVTFTNPLNGQPLTGTITLQKALDPIAKSYDIDGPGASELTVNGNGNAGTIFTVNTGVTSTISSLTITGGSGSNGGSINNNGNLALNGDIIKGNTTSGQGGAIYNGKFATTLSGDQILGNTATGQGGGIYNGGGTVTITGGTVIKGNKAKNGVGGGICNDSGTVTVSGGTVINSNATGASGGGVANQGTFYMTGGEISYNFMLPGPNYGGGVYNPGSMRLLGVDVYGNSAVNGGGICTTGKLVIGQNTTIWGNNKASSNGGGIYVDGGTALMLGGTVGSNTAQLNGGGIYVHTGELTLKSGVLVSNNDAVGSDGGGEGGGVFISGGKVTVSGGTMSVNSAGYGGGGLYNWGGTLTLEEGVSIMDNSVNNQGGGIYLAGPFSTTTFNNVLVSGNKTNGNQKTTGWGVYWQNGANVTLPINLTDNDDPNGNPVKGP